MRDILYSTLFALFSSPTTIGHHLSVWITSKFVQSTVTPLAVSPLSDDHTTLSQSAARSIVHGPSCILQPLNCIHHYLDIQASAHPTSIAVQEIHGSQLTYAELREKSIQLSQSLRNLGARPNTRICLLVERSLSQVVAIFSILRIGAAYIPLDGARIPDRLLEDVIDDAQPVLVLVSRAHASRQLADRYPWFCIEDLLEASQLDFQEYTVTVDVGEAARPAYIIYTSGASA